VPSVNSYTKNHDLGADPYDAQVTLFTELNVRKANTSAGSLVLLSVSKSLREGCIDLRRVAVRRSNELSSIGAESDNVVVNRGSFEAVQRGRNQVSIGGFDLSHDGTITGPLNFQVLLQCAQTIGRVSVCWRELAAGTLTALFTVCAKTSVTFTLTKLHLHHHSDLARKTMPS
jgi:hypothetical protein